MFSSLVAARHSVRNYLDKPVEAEKLEAVLNAARLAPSAVNFQPWHFYVVKSAAARTAVQAAYNREWFAGAPIYIVVCADTATAWTRKCDGLNHADIDAAIATEHICLAATDCGLGSCWVCNFDVPLLRAALPLTETQRPVAIVSLGYEADAPAKRTARKALAEIVSEL